MRGALAERYRFWDRRECPDAYRNMEILETDPAQLASEVDAVISALPSSVAHDVEPALREHGVHVFSNASAFRWQQNIPLMLPAVNPEALELLQKQDTPGVQVNNPNCTTAGFVPLLQRIRQYGVGIEHVDVVTLQSISGKGDRVVEPDYAERIHGNAIDDWGQDGNNSNGEERKSETEPQKILGTAQEREAVLDAYQQLRAGEGPQNSTDLVPVTARTNRIPSQYGHLETVSIELDRSMQVNHFRKMLASDDCPERIKRLPSTPDRQIVVQDSVEPAEDVMQQEGMAVTAGRIRRTGEKRFSMFSLSHNLRLGATWTARHSLELYLQQHHGFFSSQNV
ncbi:MAG: Asd/ArgC dimerization domain-containing protein [Candidatus Nanohaloarchaea archaeon]|nr:Asd/ArgC dimerization domain-containing protein [Candidatus Nanohaloarchaea archaeon]